MATATASGAAVDPGSEAPVAAPVRRRRELPLLWLLALVSFGISLSFALGAPPLWGQDERAHVGYAISLLHGELPTIDTPVADDPQRYPQVAASLAAQQGPRRDIWTANHPPLFYLLATPLIAVAELIGMPGAGLLAIRLLNAAATAASVVLIGLIARELTRRPTAAGLAAALAAGSATVAYLGGFIYNDGLALATCAATLLCGVRLLRRGPTPRLLWAATAAGSAAALTRAPGVLAVATCAAMAGAAVWLHGGRRLRALAAFAVVGGVPALLAGWWYLRNLQRYGDIGATGALLRKFDRAPNGSFLQVATDPGFYRRLFEGLWVRHVPEDRWLGVLPDVVLLAALAGLAVALARWLRARRAPNPAAAVAWLALAGYATLNLISVISFHSQGGSLHERYLIPAMPFLMPLLAVGVLQLAATVPARAPERRDTLAALLVGGAMLAVGLIAQAASMRIVHTITSPITAPTVGPPAPQLAIGLAALAAAGSVAWQLWRLRSRLPITPPAPEEPQT